LNLRSLLFLRVFSPYLPLYLQRYFFAFCTAYFRHSLRERNDDVALLKKD